MASILVKPFEHNHWANPRAVAARAGLTDAQLDATVPGTAGSICQTLMHIAGAEQRHVWLLDNHLPADGEHDGWPGTERPRQALDTSGRASIELVERANPRAVLTREYQGRPHQVAVATVSVQAINHATEHRSQIATILTQQGVEPPDFSGWAWGG